MSEYGSSSTANPAATSAACACRSGLNSTAPARLAWKTPSPNWPAEPIANSRRKPGSAQRDEQMSAARHAAESPGDRSPRWWPPGPRDAKIWAWRRRTGARCAALEPAAGRLLVATPLLGDPHFARTVVYLLEHDGGGTVGVVLNRPSHTPVGQVLPDWHDAVSGPAVVFGGGPVQPDGALCLGELELRTPTGIREVVDGVSTVDLDGDVAVIAADRPPAAGVRRPRRLVARVSSTTSSPRARGGWCPAARPTCSARTRGRCGARSCAASRRRCACSRPIPPRPRRSTDEQLIGMGYVLLGHGGLDSESGVIPAGMEYVAIPRGNGESVLQRHRCRPWRRRASSSTCSRR